MRRRDTVGHNYYTQRRYFADFPSTFSCPTRFLTSSVALPFLASHSSSFVYHSTSSPEPDRSDHFADSSISISRNSMTPQTALSIASITTYALDPTFANLETTTISVTPNINLHQHTTSAVHLLHLPFATSSMDLFAPNPRHTANTPGRTSSPPSSTVTGNAVSDTQQRPSNPKSSPPHHPSRNLPALHTLHESSNITLTRTPFSLVLTPTAPSQSSTIRKSLPTSKQLQTSVSKG